MKIGKTDRIIEKRFYYEVKKKLCEIYPNEEFEISNSRYTGDHLYKVIRKKFIHKDIRKNICKIQRNWNSLTSKYEEWEVTSYLEKYNDIIMKMAKNFKHCKIDTYYEDFNGFD